MAQTGVAWGAAASSGTACVKTMMLGLGSRSCQRGGRIASRPAHTLRRPWRGDSDCTKGSARQPRLTRVRKAVNATGGAQDNVFTGGAGGGNAVTTGFGNDTVIAGRGNETLNYGGDTQNVDIFGWTSTGGGTDVITAKQGHR